jgi:hypothetical protein
VFALATVIQIRYEIVLEKLTPCVNAKIQAALTQKGVLMWVNVAKSEKNDRISEEMTENNRNDRRLRINTFVSLKSSTAFMWHLRT